VGIAYYPTHILREHAPITPRDVVAVVLTHRNRHEMLDACISSIRRYFKGDIVVVDDRSDKPIENICVKHSARLVKLSPLPGNVFRKSLAINTGVKLTNSKYILLNDVDCLHYSYVIFQLIALLNKNGGNIAVPARKNIWRSASDILRHIQNGSALRLPVSGIESGLHAGMREGETIVSRDWGGGWGYGMLMERSVFDRIGGFDEEMIGFSSEDADFSLRAIQNGFNFLFTRHVSVFHVGHGFMQGWGADSKFNQGKFRQKHGFWGP